MWRLKGKTEGLSWVCVGMVKLGLWLSNQLQYYNILGLCLILGLWLSWVCVKQSSFITIFFYDFSVVELGLWLVLGLCLSWVCVEQSSFITIFFYDFSV